MTTTADTAQTVLGAWVRQGLIVPQVSTPASTHEHRIGAAIEFVAHGMLALAQNGQGDMSPALLQVTKDTRLPDSAHIGSPSHAILVRNRHGRAIDGVVGAERFGPRGTHRLKAVILHGGEHEQGGFTAELTLLFPYPTVNPAEENGAFSAVTVGLDGYVAVEAYIPEVDRDGFVGYMLNMAPAEDVFRSKFEIRHSLGDVLGVPNNATEYLADNLPALGDYLAAVSGMFIRSS